ncbi:hypothetical protein [Streptomyces sp. NPDC056056]|uniref:hypothetical protein n=1 Tax=Streptomyces sp. NPDC056056 TaxID=3345698 RepID=UPI0035DE9B08
MTTHVQRPASVTARIDALTTPAPAASAAREETRSQTVTLNVDSTARLHTAPAPAMSAEEYQRRTLEELADDVIVDGVAYSRAEWDRMQDGGQHTTTDEMPTPTAPRTQPVWDGTGAPF